MSLTIRDKCDFQNILLRNDCIYLILVKYTRHWAKQDTDIKVQSLLVKSRTGFICQVFYYICSLSIHRIIYGLRHIPFISVCLPYKQVLITIIYVGVLANRLCALITRDSLGQSVNTSAIILFIVKRETHANNFTSLTMFMSLSCSLQISATLKEL